MAEWACLPGELLDLIIPKLFDQDRYNFSLVCRSWNAAAAASEYSNTPCLIHYCRKKRLWGFFQYKSFLYRSFTEFGFEDDIHHILCSKNGWLLMCGGDNEESTLFFFNPFNRHTKPIVDLYWRLDYWLTSLHFFHPPTSPDCFILGIKTPLWHDEVTIDILRYSNKADGWETLTYKSESYEFLVSNSAPVLHHGLVYFVGQRGDIATLDIEHRAWNVYPKSLGYRQIRNRIKRHYLLKINGDEQDALYAVFMIHDIETVSVFRLLEPEMKWERVKDLGDKMMYVSLASSFGDVAKPRSMANTICFPVFDPDDNLLFYSLKTQRYHSFEGDNSFDNITDLMRVHFRVAWIMPLPTQQLSQKLVWDDEDDVNLT
ncbi:hypothetical protein ACS0TY_019731 [Phlomoides rotata]